MTPNSPQNLIFSVGGTRVSHLIFWSFLPAQAAGAATLIAA
jgi:hypothetical protein